MGLPVNTPAGAVELAVRSGFGRVAPVRIYTGAASVAAGATTVFVAAALGQAVEGEVLGFRFKWEAEDLETSPVSLCEVTPAASGTYSPGQVLVDPFTVPVAPGNSMFWFPDGYGISFGPDAGVGLKIRNNESSTFYARGVIAIRWWNDDARRDAENNLRRGRSPFPGKVF